MSALAVGRAVRRLVTAPKPRRRGERVRLEERSSPSYERATPQQIAKARSRGSDKPAKPRFDVDRPRCKKRPTDSRKTPQSGSGSRPFIPWCK